MEEVEVPDSMEMEVTEVPSLCRAKGSYCIHGLLPSASPASRHPKFSRRSICCPLEGRYEGEGSVVGWREQADKHPGIR